MSAQQEDYVWVEEKVGGLAQEWSSLNNFSIKEAFQNPQKLVFWEKNCFPKQPPHVWQATFADRLAGEQCPICKTPSGTPYEEKDREWYYRPKI